MKSFRIVVASLAVLALAAGVWVACNANEPGLPAAPVASAETNAPAMVSMVDSPEGQRRIARLRSRLKARGASEDEIEAEVRRFKDEVNELEQMSLSEVLAALRTTSSKIIAVLREEGAPEEEIARHRDQVDAVLREASAATDTETEEQPRN